MLIFFLLFPSLLKELLPLKFISVSNKLSYQLEVQVAQRKGTAEAVINVLSKLIENLNNHLQILWN